jgi:hypothetical protein
MSGVGTPPRRVRRRLGDPSLPADAFVPKKRGFLESTQSPPPQWLGNQNAAPCLSTDRKKGLFWGVLAAKSMFRETKNEFAFVFLRFFEIFHVASHCRAVITSDSGLPRKIIPKSLR